MRFPVLLGLALGLLSVPAAAQTTGVPFINDYTVGGVGSGSTSCTSVPIPGGGLAVPFTVTASAPGLPVFIFASVSLVPGAVCLCVPCTLGVAPSPCPIPTFTACPATTNQSIDLVLGTPSCALLMMPGVTGLDPAGGPGGVFTATIALPPFVSFSTQAVVVDPLCATPAFGVVFTQAYDVFT